MSDAAFVRVTVKMFGSYLARPAQFVGRHVDSFGMSVPFVNSSNRTDASAGKSIPKG